jgi:acyl carrier protein
VTDRDDTRRRVKETLVAALQLEVDAADIPDDEPLFATGVGAASIATLELIAALEKEFGFAVDDDDLRLELFESINSIVDYLGTIAERTTAGRPSSTNRPGEAS